MKSSETIVNGLYDKTLRKKILDNPSLVAELLDYDNHDATFIVKKNTKNVIYVVIPVQQADVDLMDMTNINVATNTASSAGCASTASTAGSVSSSISTASSAGSGSSIGTAKT